MKTPSRSRKDYNGVSRKPDKPEKNTNGENLSSEGAGASEDRRQPSASSPREQKSTTWSLNGGLVALSFFALGLSTSWIQERYIENQSWWSRLSKAAREGSHSSTSDAFLSGGARHDLSSSLTQGHHPCHPKDGILDQFLHDRPEPGLHLVCVVEDRITVFRGSVRDDNATVRLLGIGEPAVVVAGDDDETRSLSVTLMKELLNLQDESKEEAHDRFLAWVAFSTEGERLFDASSFDEQLLLDHGLVVVLEAGVWRWPGVRVGFQRRVDLPHANLSFIMETLSLSPLVLSTTGFLSEAECTEIQRVAEPLVRYSEVTLMDKDAGRPASDFRTSSSVFLTRGTNLLAELNDRTASFLRIPRTHQEHLQVLRYYPGEKYDQHDDFFDPHMYQNDAATLALTDKGRRNRFATFFWYLSDVTTGGETSFPKVEGRQPRSLLDCAGTGALLVKPQRGKTVLFYSMGADGRVDPHSTHAACPVGPDSVKWASNKWVWNRPMTYIH